MIRVLYDDGKTSGITVLSDMNELSLEEAQRLVDGYVEIITVNGKDQLLVNEEGRLRGLTPNRLATRAAGRPIVGTAVLLSGRHRWS